MLERENDTHTHVFRFSDLKRVSERWFERGVPAFAFAQPHTFLCSTCSLTDGVVTACELLLSRGVGWQAWRLTTGRRRGWATSATSIALPTTREAGREGGITRSKCAGTGKKGGV